MEANLLAAEPSALALHEFNQGCDEQQPEAEARENGGKQADVEGTTRGGFRRRAATISFLALGLMQVLWVALLGYGYWQTRYAGRTDVVGEAIRLDADVHAPALDRLRE